MPISLQKLLKGVQVDNGLMECIYHYTVTDRDLSTRREVTKYSK